MKLADRAKLRSIYKVMYDLRKEAGICVHVTCPYAAGKKSVRCNKHLRKGTVAAHRSKKRHGIGICTVGHCTGKAIKGELLCKRCKKAAA